MSVEWLDIDYVADGRANAAAPPHWQDDADPVATADEAYLSAAQDEGVGVARRGCSVLYLNPGPVRVDLDTEAQAHAQYARRRAELSGLTLHRLQAAGAALLAARTDEGRAKKELADAARAALAEGMNKVAVAQHGRIARVTLYAMLTHES